MKHLSTIQREFVKAAAFKPSNEMVDHEYPGNKITWHMHYLTPDLAFEKNNNKYYKMFGWPEHRDRLTEIMREKMVQILGSEKELDKLIEKANKNEFKG